jgi:Na+-driven multidrug efflux pump
VVAITVANQAESITNIPMSGMGVALATFVSQNYGAKQHARIAQTVHRVFVLNLGISVVCSVVLATGGCWLVPLFMHDYNPEIMQMASQYLRVTALCYSLVSALFVLRNTLQGLGFTYANMMAGAGEFFGRIGVALVIAPLFGFVGVCFAGPAAWLLADAVLAMIYRKKRNETHCP